MKCEFCGGVVSWVGNLIDNPSTQCAGCGRRNCQEVEAFDPERLEPDNHEYDELGLSEPAGVQVLPAPAKPDPKKCTATVDCTNGHITTKSCTTASPLIDKGGSSDGERDYYECPDCGKSITIDYREN